MSDNELNVLFGKEIKVVVKDETITVTPIKFGQLPKALGLVQKLGASIVARVQDKTITDPAAVMEIAALGGEDLIQLVGFGIGKPREWFDDLDQDEGLEVTMAFVAVNIDFFIKRVLPTLSKNTEAMNSLISQVTQS